jgi:hypothetical protein
MPEIGKCRSGHNDSKWKQFRLTILQRDNYVCYHCGGAAVEVGLFGTAGCNGDADIAGICRRDEW